MSHDVLSLPTDQAEPRADRWALGRRFLIRVAGLPYESIVALRTTATMRWAEDVLHLEAELTGRAQTVSDLLHDAIADVTDPVRRKYLVKLRRDVFNGRLARDPAASLDAARAVGGPAGAALADWLADRQRLAELTALGPELLADESSRARAHLRQLAHEPLLRQGLVLASPSLDTYLDGYLRLTDDALNKRQRRIERTLLEYVYRVATKTSPFSTFTGVAVGEFAPDLTDAPTELKLVEEWRSFARLNMAVLPRLAQLIMDDPERLHQLPVALTSGASFDPDRIRYVRLTTTQGDDIAAVSIDMVRDSVFFLRHSQTLVRLLTLLGADQKLTYRAFADQLSEAGGAPWTEYDRYLRLMLRLGLLQVPMLHVDVHSLDPVLSFAANLRRLGHPWAVDVADRLSDLAGQVSAYGHADLGTRRFLLDHVRTEVGEISRALGATDFTLPQTLIYEDARVGHQPVRYSRDRWLAQFDAPLRTVSAMLPAFDLSLADRIVLKGFFLNRIGAGGRCDDVLRFIQEFHEDIYDEYLNTTSRRRPLDDDGDYVPQDNWLRQPDIEALDRARVAFIARMRQRWDEQGPDAAELTLSDVDLGVVSAALGPVAEQLQPRGFFLQFAEGRGRPMVVLNKIVSGLSYPFSRFTHCFDDVDGDGDGPGLADTLRRTLREGQPPGAVYAEVLGSAVTTNLNLHGQLTDYQIMCPGEVGDLPTENQLQLDDLYLEHDIPTDRLMLRSTRLGREVIPVYLGYLLSGALPEIPRTLLLLSPLTFAAVDVWGGVPDGPEDDGMRSRPGSGTTASSSPARRGPPESIGCRCVGRRTPTPTGSWPGNAGGAGTAYRSGSSPSPAGRPTVRRRRRTRGRPG